MNKQAILNYVKEHGMFEPPQIIGGYDNIPFTHEEYLAYTKQLNDQALAKGEDLSNNEIVEIMLRFTEGEDEFVYRHLECGEYIDQILTASNYNELFR